LLLTILFVSLLMVIVLSFVVMVRMEQRSTANRQQLFEARANAKMGALIGLAELQRTMGPDMRVSARSEIIHGENPDHGLDDDFVVPDTMRFWTGAWTSEDWDPGDPDDREGRFLRWLISMPEGGEDEADNMLLVDTNPVFDNDSFVTLANILDSRTLNTLTVRAGIQPVFTSLPASAAVEETGGYAWWVSDEGVKANLSLADPYFGVLDPADMEDGDFDPAVPRFLFPHRPNLNLTDWFGDIDLEEDYGENLNRNFEKAEGFFEPGGLVFDPAMDDLIDEPQVKTAIMENSLYDDFTFSSLGVMSSTRRGGLRGDLSLAFWRDADTIFPIDWNAPDDNVPFEEDFRFRRMFSPVDYDDMTQTAPGNTSVGALNPYGARWGVLRDFHNSFQKITNDDGYEVVRAYTPGNPAVGSSGSGRSYHHFPRREKDSEQILIARPDILHSVGNLARSVDEDYDGQRPLWGKSPNSSNPGQPYEHITSPVYPLLTRYIMHFEGTLVENPDQTAADRIANGISYRPEIRMKMYITMWNPYNVPISLARNDNASTRGPSWPNFRGGGNSDARNRMQISMFNSNLENFEIEIDGETWTVGREANNDSGAGNYVTLFPGTGINVRYPLAIADVRYPRIFTGDSSHPQFFGGDPHEISDYEAGEVRVFSFHSKALDATGDSGAQPGEATPFFVSLDDVGYQAWQNTFRKKLGFWSDPNSGYKAGDVVDFHFNVKNPNNTSGINSVLNGWSSNSGNPQRPVQALTTEMDFSTLPPRLPIQAGVTDPSTGEPVVVDLGYIEFAMKSGNETHPKDYSSSMDYPVPRYSTFNPRGFSGGAANTPYAGGQNPLYWLGTVSAGDPLNHVSTLRDHGPRESSARYHRGFYGDDHTSPSGQSFLTLFDVPRRPVESMGQYQHAMLSWLSHQPTYPFGNSLPDPHVPRSGVIARYNDSGETRTYMDYSWLINDTLWDDYFLSTIDPYVDTAETRLRPQRNRFVELDDTVVYNRGDSATPDEEVNYSESAGNLLLRGAFNINSTSVEAWKTVISTLSNDGITTYDPESASSGTTGSLDYPFYRHSLPLGGEDTAWTGGPRNLSDAEVTALAEYIVDEVKLRGPFLSISDFVNRRIGADSDDRSLMGGLQSALLELEANTSFANDLVYDTAALDSDFSTSPGAPAYWDENLPQFVKDKPLAFAPGDLTQADLLTSIGPVLTARSDTFVIRSYGSSGENANNDSNMKAFVEMLVQRLPDPVEAESEDEPYVTSGPFGRKFQIVGMRYLQETEL
jgi:hypothetical protein